MMRRISLVLIGFVVGLNMSAFGVRAAARAGVAPVQEVDIHSADYQAQIPHVRFEIRDVLNVMAEFDVIHLDMPVAVSQVWGRTDIHDRKIYLYRSSIAGQRATLIHEIVHVLYAQRGLQANEERVLQDEYRINGELFGAQ